MRRSTFTILILDDSAEDRAVYRRYLQNDKDYSYEIVEVDCAEVALEYCRSSRLDLLLMDYLLWDMDGLEFLEQLQEFIPLQTLPVLMMTGQGNERIAVQAFKLGIQDYLIKSQITADDFCYKVHQSLEKNTLIQQLKQQQEEQELTANIALRIRQFLNLDDILTTAVTEIRHCLKADRVIVYQFQSEGGGRVSAESVSPPWPSFSGLSLKDDFFSKEHKNYYQERQQWAISNIYQAGFNDSHIYFLEMWKIKSSLITPILLEEENTTLSSTQFHLWGLLIVHQCGDFRVWTDRELNVLRGIGVQLEIAIRHGELYQQAQKELQQRRQIEAELRRLNQELEERVLGRTMALQIANDRLQQEISVRGIAETLLRTSQIRFHKLASNIPGVIFQYLLHPDGQGLFTYVSSGCQKLLELQPNALLKNSELIKQLIYPDDLEVWQSFLREATTTLEPCEQEFRMILPSGQVKWIRATMSQSRWENQNIVCEGLLVDISDRKKVEHTLQQQIEQEKLLNTVTQRLRESLNLQDILNTAVYETHQILKSDRVLIYRMIGEHQGKVIAETCSPQVICLLNQVFESEVFPHCCQERYQQGEINCLAASNPEIEPNCLQELTKIYQIQSQLGVPIVQNGKLWGLLIAHQGSHRRQWELWETNLLKQLASQLAIAIQQSELYQKLQIELKERQEAELQLQTTNQQLKLTNQALAKATRLKDEFLANMSHELRTPLNAILGMSEGLLEEVYGSLTEKQHQSLTTIQRSGQHLLELINDILDLAKIESGQVKLEIAPVSLYHLCNSSLTFINPQAQKKKTQLILELPPTDDSILVDQRRIRQVLINLLSNAVKFTPAGGTITLRVRIEMNLETISTTLDLDVSDQLVFEVEDTGIGIAIEDQDKLFQPFVQLDNRLSRSYAGTGLGLAMVRKITELHQGSVRVRSNVGQGSCFTVSIPYKTPRLIQNNQDNLRPGEDRFLKRSRLRKVQTRAIIPTADSPLILLAEDNDLNITMVSEYLSSKGYRMVIAKNGLEAIKISQQQQPNLILMDISMPQMDGLTAIRHIRDHSTLAKIPIIALTALAMPGDEERCLAGGANLYLTKPIRLVQLLATVQTLLFCQRS